MLPINHVVFSLAFILGLLATGIPGGGLGLLGLGIGIAGLRWQLPKFSDFAGWRAAPPARIWLIAGAIGLLASLYLQSRVPQPTSRDISQFIPVEVSKPQEQMVTVRGWVKTMPRLTQGERQQIWLKARQVSQAGQPSGIGQAVQGRLYVTLPLSDTVALHPGQKLEIRGFLYRPRAAGNPQGFDFQRYLQRQGAFAGLRGNQVRVLNRGWEWGWWAVRQRIRQTQARFLGESKGALVSAMVLGSRAVDLPWDLKHAFTQVGLAHALAASGFQISMILGVVLAVSRPLAKPQQAGWGVVAILLFACLSGFEPSVLRAVVMGIAGLVALLLDRPTKPVGVLLGTAVLLLLLNPLWIWDLGFQFSFLATLGLIVTAPEITRRLDWLPPTIAVIIAVPIAAWIWTLPLQLFTFGTLAPYSILANLITSPLISVITIGGFVSGLMGLLWPLAGSLLAGLLYYPCQLLILLVKGFEQLPGSSFALGTLTHWQVMGLYGLFIWIWLWQRWQRYWQFATILALSLVWIPVWQGQVVASQVTVLANTTVPVMVIQERGAITLVNVGDQKTANFTVLPFLNQEGINQIDWAVATDTWLGDRSAWPQLLQQLPVRLFSPVAPGFFPENSVVRLLSRKSSIQQYQPLSPDQRVAIGSTQMTLIRSRPLALQLQVRDLTWLLLQNLKTSSEITWLQTTRPRLQPQVLWWSGPNLSIDLLETLQPQIVVASSTTIDSSVIDWLQAQAIPLFWTDRDGAIRWTPNHDFERLIEPIGAIVP